MKPISDPVLSFFRLYNVTFVVIQLLFCLSILYFNYNFWKRVKFYSGVFCYIRFHA